MNNSFGGSVSPRDGAVGRSRYRPLMKNLHVDIPLVDDGTGQMSQRTVFKTDGLISFKTKGEQRPSQDHDLNNNLHKQLNSTGHHYHLSGGQHYSPPAILKPSIKTSISNFKLSGTDPYHYRNPAAVAVGNAKQTPPSYADDYDESSCAVCDRKSTTIMCKNCGHDWVGRVRTKCQAHPSTVYLMDLEACTKCASKDIKELN